MNLLPKPSNAKRINQISPLAQMASQRLGAARFHSRKQLSSGRGKKRNSRLSGYDCNDGNLLLGLVRLCVRVCVHVQVFEGYGDGVLCDCHACGIIVNSSVACLYPLRVCIYICNLEITGELKCFCLPLRLLVYESLNECIKILQHSIAHLCTNVISQSTWL